MYRMFPFTVQKLAKQIYGVKDRILLTLVVGA